MQVTSELQKLLTSIYIEGQVYDRWVIMSYFAQKILWGYGCSSTVECVCRDYL